MTISQEQTVAELHGILQGRSSPLAFNDEPVPPTVLESLFEAARWAPSSMNEQPWRFVVGDKLRQPEAYGKLLDSLVEANREWARHAPVLVLVAAKSVFSRNNKPNPTAEYDTGQAVGGLLAQATHLGLGVHQMGGYDADKARAYFGIPQEYKLIAVMAIGYEGRRERLSEALQKRAAQPRTRKELSTFVYHGGWEIDSPQQ